MGSLANRTNRGIALVFVASLLWGALAVSVQYLFKDQQIHPLQLSSLRLLTSGFLFVSICYLLRVKNMNLYFSSLRNFFAITLSGLILFCAHSSYFFSIYYSNAGTGAVFLALQPLFAAIYLCLARKEKPSVKILFCMVLAFAGVLLITTDGNLSVLQFSPYCIFWGLLATVAATAYTIQPASVIARIGVLPVASWGILAGGIAGSLLIRPWEVSLDINLPVVLNFSFIVIFCTIVAFWLYLDSLRYISPVIVTLVACLEPVSAYVFAFVLLDEGLSLIQSAGIICILITVCLLSKPPKKKILNSLAERR